MPDLFVPKIDMGAVFSEDRRYRYKLWRIWDAALPYVNFLMLNPSTADEVNNDPTIERQCRRVDRWNQHGRRWGGVHITNAFAFRATDPMDMRRQQDPVGPRNMASILEVAAPAGMVVLGWGVHCNATKKGHGADIVRSLIHIGQTELYALKILPPSMDPGHPLYIGYDAPLLPFPVTAHLHWHGQR